jgi:5-methylcytosine-specific restriction protein A
MPTAPHNSKCSQLGCHNPKSKLNGYCIEHGGKDARQYKYNNTKERAAFGAKYNTAQWVKLRQIQLSKHPLCIACQAEGRIIAASVVDHLFPWSHISEQAFFINRFQSLCATHHATKTQLERHGIYRAFGMPHKDYARSDYARVMGVDDPKDAEKSAET